MIDHNRRDSDTLTGKIAKLWPMLVALISVIAMATTLKNKVDNHEDRIIRLESSLDRIASNTDKMVDILQGNKRR